MTRLIFACCLALATLVAGRGDADVGNEQIQVYGSLRPEAIAQTQEGGDLLRRMDDGYSRIGFKGQTDLGSSWQGFLKYERRVSANDGEDDGAVRADHNELRQVHVGITGPLGSVSIGRHYGHYYDYIDDELDRHRSHYSDAVVFGDLFVSDAILLRSPSTDRGEIGILVQFNGPDASGDAIDERIEIAGSLHLASASLRAGFVSSPDHDGLLGLSASHPLGPLNLTGVYQRLALPAGDQTLLSGAVDIDLPASRSARLAVTFRRNDTAGGNDDLYAIAGIDQRLSGHLLLFGELFSRSTDTTGADETSLATGLRFDF